MAKRTASAKKQVRAGARRTVRNRGVRSSVKTLIVKARRALSETAGTVPERLETAVEAVRALDRAAAKGILHPNNAARRKARLARQMAKLARVAVAPARAPAAAPAAGKGAGKGRKAAPAPAPAPSASKKK